MEELGESLCRKVHLPRENIISANISLPQSSMQWLQSPFWKEGKVKWWKTVFLSSDTSWTFLPSWQLLHFLSQDWTLLSAWSRKEILKPLKGHYSLSGNSWKISKYSIWKTYLWFIVGDSVSEEASYFFRSISFSFKSTSALIIMTSSGIMRERDLLDKLANAPTCMKTLKDIKKQA